MVTQQHQNQAKYPQNEQKSIQQSAFVIPIPIQQAIPIQEQQIPQEIQEMVPQFNELRKRLNCWMYVLFVFNIVSLTGIQAIFGDYWYIGLFLFIFGELDSISWLAGIMYGRKVCNDYYLDEISKIVKFIQISILFSTLYTIFNIIYSILINEGLTWIVAIVNTILYVIFVVVRQVYFINPGKFFTQQFQELSKQYPPNAGKNSLAMKVRDAVGPTYD